MSQQIHTSSRGLFKTTIKDFEEREREREKRMSTDSSTPTKRSVAKREEFDIHRKLLLLGDSGTFIHFFFFCRGKNK
jgi:hypothetical protein